MLFLRYRSPIGPLNLVNGGATIPLPSDSTSSNSKPGNVF